MVNAYSNMVDICFHGTFSYGNKSTKYISIHGSSEICLRANGVTATESARHE